MDEQSTAFFTYNGSSKFAPPPHPRIIEFNRLKFFWKNFGINKFDLYDKCDPQWVEETYLVGLGFEKAKQQITEGSSKSGPSVANKIFKGPTVREKLL